MGSQTARQNNIWAWRRRLSTQASLSGGLSLPSSPFPPSSQSGWRERQHVISKPRVRLNKEDSCNRSTVKSRSHPPCSFLQQPKRWPHPCLSPTATWWTGCCHQCTPHTAWALKGSLRKIHEIRGENHSDASAEACCHCNVYSTQVWRPAWVSCAAHSCKKTICALTIQAVFAPPSAVFAVRFLWSSADVQGGTVTSHFSGCLFGARTDLVLAGGRQQVDFLGQQTLPHAAVIPQVARFNFPVVKLKHTDGFFS